MGKCQCDFRPRSIFLTGTTGNRGFCIVVANNWTGEIVDRFSIMSACCYEGKIYKEV